MRQRQKAWLRAKKTRKEWAKHNRKIFLNVTYTKSWCSDCKSYEFFATVNNVFTGNLDEIVRQCECLPF